MKKTHLWIIGIVLAFMAGGLIIGKVGLAAVLPYGFILICPVMMLFMMKDHHKD